MTEKEVAAEVAAEENESSDEQKSYDAEYVKKLKAEAKEYRTSKAALKKEFEEVKTKLEALEAEKLTETEKDKKKIAELEKALSDINSTIKAKDIDNLILKASIGKNFVDAETAALLIKKELEDAEEINDASVNKAIDSLIKSKPFLVGGTSTNISDGNFAKTTKEPSKDPNRMFAEWLSK
jgi:predicted RNase H-like nuclease (RuvC/YqgF family)